MADVNRRRELLTDLIEVRRPLSESLAAVRGLPWDSDVDLVILTRSHVVELLGRYLNGELDAVGVEAWAEAIEVRDDVGAEPGHEDVLRQFVFETANPLLAEPVTEAGARRWLEQLGARP
jgi:hypothetical protein